MKKNKKILVIGARGMLGQTVYKYLKLIYPNTYGTHHSVQKGLFLLNASNLQKNFKKIIKETKDLDFIINCIGILPSAVNKREMSLVNSLFPKRLAYLAQKNESNVIHISTDAVFPYNSGFVYENTLPKPDSLYGKSKLKGEINNKNLLNIRTSIIGLDPISHKGLLEWVKLTKNINGYINQKWSGCTTLQFAKLCEYLINADNFTRVRTKSPIIHYVPLGPVSKYDLIKTFLNVSKENRKLNKIKNETTIDRALKSIYNILPGENDLETVLFELVQFFKK